MTLFAPGGSDSQNVSFVPIFSQNATIWVNAWRRPLLTPT